MRLAVAATAEGFEDVVRGLPRGGRARAAASAGRGHLRPARPARGQRRRLRHHRRRRRRTPARCTGSATTARCATGDLLLVDAGVEVDSLYTADVTRTLPVNGTVHRGPAPRSTRPCSRRRRPAWPRPSRAHTFRDVHDGGDRGDRRAAARVGAAAGRPSRPRSTDDGQQHRRWMVHGTSHHLGLDVHDCSQAREETYLDGVARAGHGPDRRAGPLLPARRPELVPGGAARASASGSRTTCWSPTPAARTSRRCCPASPTRSRRGWRPCAPDLARGGPLVPDAGRVRRSARRRTTSRRPSPRRRSPAAARTRPGRARRHRRAPHLEHAPVVLERLVRHPLRVRRQRLRQRQPLVREPPAVGHALGRRPCHRHPDPLQRHLRRHRPVAAERQPGARAQQARHRVLPAGALAPSRGAVSSSIKASRWAQSGSKLAITPRAANRGRSWGAAPGCARRRAAGRAAR